MDINNKIKLGEYRYVNALNEDVTIKLPISTSNKTIVEYDLKNVLDVTRLFDIERQSTDIYRIHGEIEYLSVLNSIPQTYRDVEDFFTKQPKSASTKNLISDFNFYLVRAIPPRDYILMNNDISDGYDELVADELYISYFEIITELKDFSVFNAGYSRNVFDEQQNGFTIDMDIDVSSDVDGLNFPISEVYIYAIYNVQENGDGDMEVLTRKGFNSSGNTTGQTTGIVTAHTKGDVVIGNVITYSKTEYLQTIYNEMEYYIETPYENGSLSLKWKYKPFIPITLRVFSDDIQTFNTGSTSYDDIIRIPSYSKQLDNDGNVIWRNFIDKGIIDPLTGEGVNYPFINNRNYIFKNVVLDIQPDLTDENTLDVFNEILFATNEFVSATPNSPLLKIGDLCD